MRICKCYMLENRRKVICLIKYLVTFSYALYFACSLICHEICELIVRAIGQAYVCMSAM